ncbi:unnamed protein product [Rotaria sp. Silwood1]|nr:unnamed protein product [Rotaria sp. Silwood1]CAF4992237.1 unnamed protein product [Rotaria sp. Silwood1]CAF5098044.1 unnamed protein product [Rotaria sp. Silwood1]
MALKVNRSSYTSRVHQVCLFNSSCNRSFIKDWIEWQEIAINKTIQAAAVFNTENILTYSEFKIWSSSYQNITDLCFNSTTDQNETRNTYPNSTVFSVTTTPENITPNIKVDDTNNCLRYGDTYENVRRNISSRVIELINFVKQYNSLNSKKNIIGQTFTTIVNIPLTDGLTSSLININQPIIKELTTMINQDKSSVIFIVCFISWNNYRHGYRPTATS